MEGELATEIAAGVGATLSLQEKARVEAKPTNNPAAYDAYLRGRALAARTYQRSYAENAIQSYQEAVKLDPSFALAWTRLSVAQSSSYWRFDPSPARLGEAKDAADHALALDPNLPETHLALGYYRYYGQLDFTEGRWRNSCKLSGVFRITLMSPMQSLLSNAGLGIGKRPLEDSVVWSNSTLDIMTPITISRLRIGACAVFPKL